MKNAVAASNNQVHEGMDDENAPDLTRISKTVADDNGVLPPDEEHVVY
jgi:hypothetical protein